MIGELGIDNSLDNHAHIPYRNRKSRTITNLLCVPLAFPPNMNNWIPKLHRCPYRQLYISGFTKCSTKPLSKLLISIPSAIKTGLRSYCDNSYSRGGVNQMWILNISSDPLENIQSRSFSSSNSITTFDFSTFYATIPYSKLKNTLN